MECRCKTVVEICLYAFDWTNDGNMRPFFPQLCSGSPRIVHGGKATSSVGPSAIICGWMVWSTISLHLIDSDGTHKDDKDVPYQADSSDKVSKHRPLT